jgi:hypothetical protein
MIGLGARMSSTPRVLLLAFASLLALTLLASDADAKKKKKKKVAPVVSIAQTQTVQPEANASVVATCPANKTVVGGGFASGPIDAEFIDGTFVHESRMQGNGWKASGANLSLSEPGTLSAYAYCRKGATPLTEVAATVNNCNCTPLVDAVATCPTPTKPVAGGFYGPLTSADGGVIPQTSKRFGAFAWKFTGFDFGFDPADLTAYAYCGPKARLETSGVRVIEGTNASGTAYAPLCKRRGHKMLAGGFQAAQFDPIFTGVFEAIAANNADAGRFATNAVEGFIGPGTLQSFGYCG